MFFIFLGIGWFDPSWGIVTLEKDRKVDLFPSYEPFGGKFRSPAGHFYALRKATNQVFVFVLVQECTLSLPWICLPLSPSLKYLEMFWNMFDSHYHFICTNFAVQLIC